MNRLHGRLGSFFKRARTRAHKQFGSCSSENVCMCVGFDKAMGLLDMANIGLVYLAEKKKDT